MTALLDAYDLDAYERVVVLSPHLDDAVLSCGGLLAQLGSKALVITISCSRPPKGAHGRSRNRRGHAPPVERRREDILAMERLGCHFVHLGFSDAVYRRSPTSGQLIYRSSRPLLSRIPVDDLGHMEEVYVVLRRLVSDMGPLLLLSPMAVGYHVDHVICSQIAGRLSDRRTHLLYYEDFPYVLGQLWLPDLDDDPHEAIARLGLTPGVRRHVPFDIDAKAAVIGCYRSQLPALFGDEERLRRSLEGTNPDGEPREYYWTVRRKSNRRAS